MKRKEYYVLITVTALVLAAICRASAFGQSGKETGIGGAVRQTEMDGTRDEKEADRAGEVKAGPLLESAVDPDEYILGPYDHLTINLMGPEQRSFDLLVLPEGEIFLPGIGSIRADGLTLTEFREVLRRHVHRYFKNIEVICHLAAPRVFRVFITGEVGRPGAVHVSAVERVSDVVERADGIKPAGSARMIRLERGGEMTAIDYLRYELTGDFDNNPYLRSGDRIHVPAGGWRVTLHGAVIRPGKYEVVPGETVADLIELAGGLTPEADGDTIIVSRSYPSGHVKSFSIPGCGPGTELRNRDEIHVRDRLSASPRVFVTGAVETPGRYKIGPGEGLAELVARLDMFNEYADLESAYLERADGTHLRIDLRRYLTGGKQPQRLALADGDILHIPDANLTVAVGGEVHEPGRFSYRADWTVAQYVGMAGGPTPDGSIDRVTIYSPDGTSRGAGRDSKPGRGDVIVVKRSKTRLFGDFFKTVITLGTVVVSIIVLTR